MFAPIKELNQNIQTATETLDKITYWLDPRNAHKEIVAFLDETISGGKLDEPLLAATIGGVVLIGLGAQWPKKWIFWGWIAFWILRGAVFR